MEKGKTVIIPKFDIQDEFRHYLPAFVKINVGDEVRWINKDRESHTLEFFGINDEQFTDIEHIGNFGPLKPEQSMKIPFEKYYFRIDYICKYHSPKEINYVLFNPESKGELSNTERLRYLSRKFSIKPPDFMDHLNATNQ
jgi:plastocyanin